MISQKISLITPTGSRPAAFKLCEQWMKNQRNLGPHKIKEWLVVDDCQNNPTKCTMGQTYLKGPKEWRPGFNTQRYNMDVLLERVTGDIILVIEDDEYYSPEYLSTMVKLLESASIAGLSNSRYYHLQAPGWKFMNNYQHASLCQSAIRKEALPLLVDAVHSGEYYFDIQLWKKALETGASSVLLSNTNLSIGIKGMPGRSGLGAGHEMIGYKGDRDMTMLNQWLGDDAKYYSGFSK